jgi:hypothetical protein
MNKDIKYILLVVLFLEILFTTISLNLLYSYSYSISAIPDLIDNGYNKWVTNYKIIYSTTFILNLISLILILFNHNFGVKLLYLSLSLKSANIIYYFANNSFVNKVSEEYKSIPGFTDFNKYNKYATSLFIISLILEIPLAYLINK